MLDSTVASYLIGFFSLVGMASIIGIIKVIDWAIYQKYVTHEKCERCRNEIYKTISIDHDLLQKVDGKLDIMLDYLDIKRK